MNLKINKRDGVKFYTGVDSCPFCNIDKSKIIWKGKYFFIMINDNPYITGGKHLLVNPFRHILFTKDLSKDEILEFIEVEKFMFNFYKNEDYFSFIRQSLTNNSRTVEHLHYHYLSGSMSPEGIQEAISL